MVRGRGVPQDRGGSKYRDRKLRMNISTSLVPKEEKEEGRRLDLVEENGRGGFGEQAVVEGGGWGGSHI